MSAKEILEPKWFTDDVTTMPCRWTDVLEKNTSELLQSNLLQVMGVIELKPTLLEGTGDQNREDSGENLNIALTNSRCNYYSCCPLL